MTKERVEILLDNLKSQLEIEKAKFKVLQELYNNTSNYEVTKASITEINSQIKYWEEWFLE